jgi:hypothetical protein
MPPKGKKLADAQIEDLVAWVKMGAPDPRVATVAQKAWSDSSKKHWAWQPLKKSAQKVRGAGGQGRRLGKNSHRQFHPGKARRKGFETKPDRRQTNTHSPRDV